MNSKWMGFAIFCGLALPPAVTADTTVVVPAGEAAAIENKSAAIVVLPVTQMNAPNSTSQPGVTIPVAVPVDAKRNLNTVAWKELNGSVQSVDRYNLAMTVQDGEGKDIFITMNDRVRIFKGGTQIAYADVEPNDRVKLRYNAE